MIPMENTLVMTDIAIQIDHRNNGCSHETWWIFPVRKLLVITRGYLPLHPDLVGLIHFVSNHHHENHRVFKKHGETDDQMDQFTAAFVCGLFAAPFRSMAEAISLHQHGGSGGEQAPGPEASNRRRGDVGASLAENGRMGDVDHWYDSMGISLYILCYIYIYCMYVYIYILYTCVHIYIYVYM